MEMMPIIFLESYRVDENSTFLCYNTDIKKGVDPNE